MTDSAEGPLHDTDGAHARIPERFIVATAKALIDRHGIDADVIAAARADQRLALGDPDGAAAWHRIKSAIEEMQRI